MKLRYHIIASLAFLYYGCAKPEPFVPPNLHENVQIANGFDVIYPNERSYILTVGDWDFELGSFKEGSVFAEDIGGDGRFDRLTLLDVPKGSPLEELASLRKFEEIKATLLETQTK